MVSFPFLLVLQFGFMVDAPITKEGRDAERTRMKPGRKKREPIGLRRNFSLGLESIPLLKNQELREEYPLQ